jgi:hypothetical protein
MRDMNIQQELDMIKEQKFAKMSHKQLQSIENVYRYDDELIEIAKKYKTKVDFKNNNPNAYKTAWSRGLTFFNKICSHMKKNSNKPYTKQELRDEAKKYINKKQFRKKSAGAYIAALNKGKDFLNDICKHMSGPVYVKYTIDDVKNIAKKYSKRSVFAKEEPRAYYYAVRHKLLDIVCEHM